MGGFGSGRRCGNGRDTVESRCSLDVNALQRAGHLQTGRTSFWQWTSRGECRGSVSLTAGPEHLRLSFRVPDRQTAQEMAVEQDIPLVRLPCGFGGSRRYFVCSCERRVARLYYGSRFLCRQCANLCHASQLEDASGRARRRAQKILERLGGDCSPRAPFPRKPKHMHWSTYLRMEKIAVRAARDADAFFMEGCRSFLDRNNARATLRQRLTSKERDPLR